ncbi:MAG TPA: hypothetical protein VFU37_23790 [Pyrinomonadaceae bacterium]|nr:hypothetical protein [Pyrinomonadaceae bacterium]
MSKSLTAILGAVLLAFSLAVVAAAQKTTVTKTVQNPDGTFTIVEYPVGKETVVTLNPIGITATGTATILRDANGATIKLNLASLPADVSALNLYAVDPTGAVTALGPVEIASGVGTFMTTTPLTKFMLFAAPDANLTAYDANTKIIFRSAVPAGLTVIPIGTAAVVAPATTVAPAVAPVGAQVAVAATDYTVPMLGIGSFKKGDESKFKLDFTGPMEGARANVFIEPHKNGKMTEVRMRFHELKEAPKGLAYILWAVSPDNQFQRLGSIVNVKGRNEAEIKSETAFDDFGLLLTTEDVGIPATALIKPAGSRVGVITIIK